MKHDTGKLIPTGVRYEPGTHKILIDCIHMSDVLHTWVTFLPCQAVYAPSRPPAVTMAVTSTNYIPLEPRL